MPKEPNIQIIVPVHNEMLFLNDLIDSLLAQTLRPQKIILVNDNSTDNSPKIIDDLANKHSFISKVDIKSNDKHMPGSKVIKAFNLGYENVDLPFDYISKLDADVILPNNYFEIIYSHFLTNPKAGILGGFIYEKNKGNEWVKNHPMEHWHVRGAIKTYAFDCFKAIGGLKASIGWDTVDELLAIYQGYEVKTIDSLNVKHQRPIGANYHKNALFNQGLAMYKMRYGFFLTFISTIKMAHQKKNILFIIFNLMGFFKGVFFRKKYIVNKKEGRFIRNFRYKNIMHKLGLRN